MAFESRKGKRSPKAFKVNNEGQRRSTRLGNMGVVNDVALRRGETRLLVIFGKPLSESKLGDHDIYLVGLFPMLLYDWLLFGLFARQRF